MRSAHSLQAYILILQHLLQIQWVSRGSRIRNLAAYFLNALRLTAKLRPVDYIMTMSPPPLTGGLLGVHGKRKLHGKLIYCIQDFYPEVLAATGYVKRKALLRAVRQLDNRTIRHADLVITVGRDLAETLRGRMPSVPPFRVIGNWTDEKAVYPLPLSDPGVAAFREQYGLTEKFVFMYSGNIGLVYDLEGLIRVMGQFWGAKTADGRDIAFAFVGNGALYEKLVRYKAERNLSHIVFIPYQEKKDLLFSLNAADVHLCVSAKGIKGVSVPSKFYGIAAAGKPVLGVLEEGAEIERQIREAGCGRVTEPGDYAGFAESIRYFTDRAGTEELYEMGRRGRAWILKHAAKSAAIAAYTEAIKAL